jgi:hypothetical protein
MGIHKMRPPGLEPGTPAWKADMLTPTPQTQIKHLIKEINYIYLKRKTK